jgi:BRO1-like domain
MSYNDLPEPNLNHPDSCIRLASAVHRFQFPQIRRTVAFSTSFRTAAAQFIITRTAMTRADDHRTQLQAALSASTISGERVDAEAARYQPFLSQILLTCQVQPEVARLDERLLFTWSSGLESTSEKPTEYASEALMYDVVMVIACRGLAKAATATEASVAGDFAAANREYNAAAGIIQFLAHDHLPKWIAKGTNVEDAKLPTEASIGVCEAMTQLFLANAQQMAVSLLLLKPGTPNYSLLSKLCLGISERYHSFVSILRKQAFLQMGRMGKDVFTLTTFQTTLQQALSQYFQARDLWEKQEYGLAIAILSEAKLALNTRTHAAAIGMPDIIKGSPLTALSKDLMDLKAHMGLVLKHWEQDNSNCYFEKVPAKVPEEVKLSTGIQLNKIVPYQMDNVDPLPLSLPDEALKRSDSDLARELQDEMNLEEFEA